MAVQGFLTRVAGKTLQLFGLQASTGTADAGKLVATGSDGRLDLTFLPTGVGRNQVVCPATEALSAGRYVNLFNDGGVLSARLADNSNNREAWGYVKDAVASSAQATVYRLNTVNAGHSGLTPGANYWLGTVGGVTDTPLDPSTDTGKTDQFLGVALSTTELVTAEYEPVRL